MVQVPPSGEFPDPRDALFDTSDLKVGMSRKAGNASVWLLAISLTKVFVLVGGIAIIARLIPPDQYGVFALAMPAVAICMALSNFGLAQAVVQRRTLTHAEASTLFWVNTGIALLGAGLIFLLAPWAARLFDDPRVTDVYRVIAPSVIFATMVGQYGALLQRRLRSASYEVIQLMGEAIALVVAIGLALWGASYWSLVIQQLLSQIAPLVLAVIYTGWRPSSPAKARITPVKDAIGFGGYVAGTGILNKLIQYGGSAVAGIRLEAAAVGLFNRALRLGNLPAVRLMGPLSGSFVPTLAALRDDPAQMEKIFIRMTSRANLILLPVSVVIAAGAAPIVAIAMGPTWAAAAPLLAWMSLRSMRASVNYSLGYLLLANGQGRVLFFNTLFRFVLVTLVIYVAAGYGLVTMAAAFVLTEMFVTLPVMTWLAVRHTPISLKAVLRPCIEGLPLAIALALALIFLVNPWLSAYSSIVHLAGLCVIVGTVYAIRIAIDPSLRRDISGILSRITGKLTRRRGSRS